MITTKQKQAFNEDGYVVLPKLLDGDDLAQLDAMCDAALNGVLAPETPFQGWLPDHFYTFWEPGYKDRDELPRRDRVRSLSASFVLSRCGAPSKHCSRAARAFGGWRHGPR